MQVIKHLPLELFQDETSGIANLDARERDQFEAIGQGHSENVVALVIIAAVALFLLGVVIGASF